MALHATASQRLPRRGLPLVVVGLAILALEAVAEPEQTLFWRTLFDLGHAPLFGIIALAMRRLLVVGRGETPEWRRSVEAFVLAAGLGAATEILQLFQPARDVSAADVLRDSAGAAAFLLMRHALPRSAAWSPRRGWRRGGPLAVAVALLVAVAAPFAAALALYDARNRALPVLYRLDGSWWERRLISARHARLATADGADCHAADDAFASLDLDAGTYPGLVFDEPYPDWSRYRRLVLATRSEADRAIVLTLRIHDALHNQRYEDRFNREIVVLPGTRRIVIEMDEIRRAPRGREMDLRRIRGLVLFAYRLDRPMRLGLGPLRLE